MITPWDVTGGTDGAIDYDKLTKSFGCSLISQELIDRIEKCTGVRAHHFLRRGIFFAHRCRVPCGDRVVPVAQPVQVGRGEGREGT